MTTTNKTVTESVLLYIVDEVEAAIEKRDGVKAYQMWKLVTSTHFTNYGRVMNVWSVLMTTAVEDARHTEQARANAWERLPYMFSAAKRDILAFVADYPGHVYDRYGV